MRYVHIFIIIRINIRIRIRIGGRTLSTRVDIDVKSRSYSDSVGGRVWRLVGLIGLKEVSWEAVGFIKSLWSMLVILFKFIIYERFTLFSLSLIVSLNKLTLEHGRIGKISLNRILTESTWIFTEWTVSSCNTLLFFRITVLTRLKSSFECVVVGDKYYLRLSYFINMLLLLFCINLFRFLHFFTTDIQVG